MHLVCGMLAVACVAASEASGQVVRGRIGDGGDDQGVGGAMVTLLDRSSVEQDRTLTRSDGHFLVQARESGEFRVRVERIGYATTFSEFVRVAVGDTVTLDVSSVPEAIRLDGVVASADRRCTLRPTEALAVARVWDEARKALAATAWTADRKLHRYETLRTERRLDTEGRKVESETRLYEQRRASVPFSARSADSLMAHGFVHITSSEILFWGPDAEVLLSDAFLDAHCFRLAPSGDGENDAIGIEFQPAEAGGPPDIAGTMWLDRRTAHLRRVDFRFVNLSVPSWLLDAEPGGSVDFLTLPDGTWIVPAWHLRMFRAGDGGEHPLTGRPYPTLEGITIETGRVLRAHGEGGVVFESAPGYRIAGMVRDSLGNALSDARVFLSGSGAEATTDSAGRFELAHLAPAEYTLYVSHPYLDAVWHPPTPFTVTIAKSAAEPVPVVFDAPPLKEVLPRICDSADPPSPMLSTTSPPKMISRAGILTGHVTDQGGVPLAGVRVVILPAAYAVTDLMDPKKMRAMAKANLRSPIVAKTSSDGFYRACWVPVDMPLEVVVLTEDDFDEDQLDLLQDLRTSFPERHVRALTIDPQSPHRYLRLRDDRD